MVTYRVWHHDHVCSEMVTYEDYKKLLKAAKDFYDMALGELHSLPCSDVTATRLFKLISEAENEREEAR